jgi:hypothetical protein
MVEDIPHQILHVFPFLGGADVFFLVVLIPFEKRYETSPSRPTVLSIKRASSTHCLNSSSTWSGRRRYALGNGELPYPYKPVHFPLSSF